MTVAQSPTPMSRREAIKAGLGVVGLVVAHGWLSACGPVVASATTGTTGSGSSPSPNLPQATGSAGAWAAGGTQAMKASYPDPFTTQVANRGTACQLTCTATLGPCHVEAPERQDISEALTGLPTRMSFQVLKADGCTPVAGAVVEVWHTNLAGIYSAFPMGSLCNPSGEDVAAARFCRGHQKTDAQGRVDFHTVFPGWYSGRTVHVHLKVVLDGRAFVVTQLVFDDALTDEIYQQHPEYKSRSNRDTRNSNDRVVSAAVVPDISFATLKTKDGVLQAWKTITLRSSLADSPCAIAGGSGGGGAPPAGGMGGPMGSPAPRP